MNPTQYTVKAGDTLNSIAAAHGYPDYTAANIQGYGSNPDLITPGMVLTVGGTPKTQEIPGIGTMTITPKAIPTASPSTSTPEDLSGAYARAGLPAPVAPPPAGTANGYTAPAVAGLPTFPSGVNTSDYVSQIKQQYADTLNTINELQDKIASSSSPSADEQALQQKLDAAKATLANFDVETLQAEQNLSGQGRGATLGTINTEQTILDRTRALQRLGLSTDADTIATQLSTATANRNAENSNDTAEYNMAKDKLDLVLNIGDKLNSLSQQDQTNARQYLLDVVNFAGGKTYDQLDPDTQEAITSAVAESPITLGLVKTALSSAAQKAQQTASGTLREVPGTGLVSIKPDGSYDVIVPENTGNGGFTTTQQNKGAANAGIPISDFNNLDTDTKNYFINTYPSSQLSKDIAAIGTPGSKTAQQIADDTSSSNLSDGVKNTVYQRLGVQPNSGGSSSGGFLSSVGGAIKNFLGI